MPCKPRNVARMSDPLKGLTDKEKETLRLIVRGHDAKSAARDLDLSVHTINERLRSARRKLDVTSSREAARMLLESEGDLTEATPEKPVYEAMGDASASPTPDDTPITAFRSNGALWTGGIIMIAVSALALVFAAMGPLASHDPRGDAGTQIIRTADAEKEAVARDWLALVDAEKWDAAHAAGSARFRDVLNLPTFRSTTRAVRTPLGAIVSREVIAVSDVEDDGQDYVIVQFRSDFENQTGLTEQVALERDGGALKVTGYFFV